MILSNFFKFSFFVSLLFLISCSDKNNIIKEVSLNSLSSISSLQGSFSKTDSEEEEENPELRFSFQMMSADPKAVLPADKMVKVGALVEIDGAMSENAVSYRWSFDVFPENSNTIINDQTASTISFRPDVEGLYLVKLVVRDADTNSEASYLAIRATTDNTPPNFRFSVTGSSRNNGFPRETVIRLRDIVDDEKVSFAEIDYGDGNKTVFYKEELDRIRGNINHHYLSAGSYKVTVSIFDNKGLKTTKSTMINLRARDKIPSLKYSVNSTSGTAPFTLRVDTSATSDSNNDKPFSFYFDWDDGASAYGKDVVFTHTYTKPGIYTVEAFMRDKRLGERYNYFTVYIDDPDNPGTYKAPAGGSPPIVNLKKSTDNFSGQVPLTITFDASETFDLEGDDFEIFWSFDGFSNKEFEKGLRVTKTYEYPGKYALLVGARDSHGNEYMRYYEVFVYDPLYKEKPSFTIRQRSSNPYRINFNTSVSELYGIPANYRFWNLGDGNFSAFNTNHTYSEKGNYPITMTSVDIFGNRQSVSRVLTIDGQKHNIDAKIDPFYKVAQVSQEINFTGKRSSSAVSGPLDFIWYLVTGLRRSVESFTYSYSKRGVYQNIMRATNEHGLSDRTYSQVVVNSGKGPKARAKFSSYVGTAPLTVNFDGSSSTSPAGTTITDYEWHFGDYDDIERGASGVRTSYTYKNPGTKYQELHVKDSNGNFDIDFYSITVLNPDEVDPNNQAPIVRIDTSKTEINDLYVDIAARFSDSDGSIVYTDWDWGDGQVDVFNHFKDSPNHGSRNYGSYNHTYKNYGSYTIKVRAFDNMGAIGTTTYDITLARSQQAPGAQRSAPIQRVEQQNQRVYLPADQFSYKDKLEEEREKEGCYKKADGQTRCYAPKDRGGL